MKLNQTIKITPPPFSNAAGQIIQPKDLIFDTLNVSYTDFPTLKRVTASILNIPQPIVLYADKEYDHIGDWTQKQAEEKLLTILGDDPSSYLRKLFPKTLEENPNGPGTLLSKMIKSMGIVMTDSCSCKRHAIEMNNNGNDWCEKNIDTIIGWLREEAKRRKLPFVDMIGKVMINRAIKKSRKLLANEPVPDNDEDLDKE